MIPENRLWVMGDDGFIGYGLRRAEMKVQLRLFDYIKLILYPSVIIRIIFQQRHSLFEMVDIDDN